MPPDYDSVRYLAAKRTVDDRALHRPTWERFLAERGRDQWNVPVRILEIGSGIGTMAERIVQAIPEADLHYTLLDQEPAHTEEMLRRLPRWAETLGYECRVTGKAERVLIKGEKREHRVTVEAVTSEAFAFARSERASRRPWDVLLGQAVLDLVPVSRALDEWLALLRRGGLFYFPITFDGITAFLPEGDPDLDRQITDAYHASMDARSLNGDATGGSRTGRRLLGELQSRPLEMLSAGGSDWVVFASENGYEAREAYFLHCILHFVGSEQAVRGAVGRARLEEWLRERHRQVEQGSLGFLAHHIDVLGRKLQGREQFH